MLFDFLGMMNNYEERKVAHYEKDKVTIDTCAVNDADQPYETAVAHSSYNDANLVIVELYDTKEEAKRGHKKWVKKMTAKNLPKILIDVSSSEVAKLVDCTNANWRIKNKLTI